MPTMDFRAWNGREVVYNIALTSHGVALRQARTCSDDKLLKFILEPSWIVTRWSGFFDRDDTKIYEDDIVELGGEKTTTGYAIVRFLDGHFNVVHSDQRLDEELVTLEKYCNNTFRHMIRVVGTIYETHWRDVFRQLQDRVRLYNEAQDGRYV